MRSWWGELRGHWVLAVLVLVTVLASAVLVLDLNRADSSTGQSPSVQNLAAFGEVPAVVRAADGSERVLCLLKADTAALRERGLMTVTDPNLNGYDGMLFMYASDTTGAFWMRNTPMPLSLAYLNASGQIVSTVDMEPCADSDQCPVYPPAGPYRYSLEVPQGGLSDIGLTGGATLTPGDGECEH
ncbi:DUF192 domain-containing protein [Goodfellowiella coeruleoviolacea]|uniref:Uncharacterized conserved membrane protein, UPF0127 family n=1 Tax=Goodfellowiella coeruleoviolacea TaxID=334858 RepID=A0AAE3GJF0_9PSEU|nr:DUF192 domain-containing protein [Goodfellowiella coeruleoviolacea]MCP2169285.1 Uncharacterized conserved membrane protein, UPF0127 family [Goodfellowiella coeruleoviolacea]